MAAFQPKLEAITTLLGTHRVSAANLLELCSKLSISPFIFGEEIISHSYARRIGVFGGGSSPNREQPFEALDEDVEDDLKPIGLQDSPEMVTRHYFQLPPEIWAAIGSSVEPILYWRDVLPDEFLRGAENWLQWEGSKEFFQIHPAFEIRTDNLSPLLLSREILNVLGPHLRLLSQHTPSEFKKSHSRSGSNKPHTIFIDQLIKEGCLSWKKAWSEFKNLDDNEWHQYGEFTFRVSKGHLKYSRGFLAVESDDGLEYGLTSNTFQKAFSRRLARKS